MKCDFSTVIFTDECRATLDGPDCWTQGWLREGQAEQVRLRRQQGGGGVMFWAGIVNDELIGPFRVEDGVKINSENYCEFLNDHFLPWFKKQPERKNSPSFSCKIMLPHMCLRPLGLGWRLRGFPEDELCNGQQIHLILTPLRTSEPLSREKFTRMVCSFIPMTTSGGQLRWPLRIFHEQLFAI